MKAWCFGAAVVWLAMLPFSRDTAAREGCPRRLGPAATEGRAPGRAGDRAGALLVEPAPATRGVRLEHLTWPEAEKVLTPDALVVLPIGAAAKEHGPHLQLRTDLILAEYFTERLLERSGVVVAPTLTYHYYPSFLEYPGSTSLALETARDLTVDVVRTLAAYGPRRFYGLNTGVSTVRALRPAAERLAAEGILFRFTDLAVTLGPIEGRVAEQPGGSHADEIETSMLLYIDPSSVDMRKAVKDFDAAGKGPLSRIRGKPDTTYSPSGVYGDATLATPEKGRVVVEAFVDALVREVEETRAAAVPIARPARPRVRLKPDPTDARRERVRLKPDATGALSRPA